MAVNYLPDGKRNRVKSIEPDGPYYGKLTFSINLSYPDMPFEGGESAAGYRDPMPFQSPQAGEKIKQIGETLRELGIPFEPVRTRHDPRSQGIGIIFQGHEGSTDAPLTNTYGEIPYHIFVVTPDAEQLTPVADRLLADKEFRQWCAANDIQFFTHPYTGKALDMERSAEAVIAQLEEDAEDIAQAYAKAEVGGYLPELQKALREKTRTK